MTAMWGWGGGGPWIAPRKRPDSGRDRSVPDAAGRDVVPLPHRYLPLRFVLELLAAVEAGWLIAVVPGWTPVRSIVAAVALIAGIAAASAVVVLLGTWHRIRRPLAALLGAAMLAGVAGPAATTRIPDPTQIQPGDLEFSVSCEVIAVPSFVDRHGLDVRVSVEWLRKDVLPTGIAREPWVDAVMVAGVPVDSVAPALAGNDRQAPYDPTPARWLAWTTPAVVNAPVPTPGFGPYWSTWDDWHRAVHEEEMGAFASVDPSIAPGTVRTATWQYMPMYPGEPIPVIYAEFRHASHFTVGVFASCTDPSRTFPRLERRLSDY